uniref:Uncharacterized protein n=1 Tax=viral metagenome TaxID=1070528 RepID=A0A6C0DW49_9ZZZZ
MYIKLLIIILTYKILTYKILTYKILILINTTNINVNKRT